MPGPRRYSYAEPVILDRDPVILDRSPGDAAVVHATTTVTERRRPRSLTLFKVYNPLTRRYHHTTLSVGRRRRNEEEAITSSRPTSRRGRASSPPPPPILHQRTSRSTPPVTRISEMSPTQGQPNYVPLPPRIPRADDLRESGRESRQSHQTEATEEIVRIIDDEPPRRRSPRPYHRSTKSDPFDVQEQVLEPTSPRARQATENFEFVQPNEPIRSRQRDADIRKHKEYIRMKELAEHNYKAASAAEVRLETLQKQLADMEVKAHKTQNELDRALHELDECRREHRVSTKERDLNLHKAKLYEDQLELERQLHDERERERARDRERSSKGKERERERERDKTRDNSGSGSGSGHRRRRPRIVHLHQDDPDAEPRTTDPRASKTKAADTRDTGFDAISKARTEAEAARQGRVQ